MTSSGRSCITTASAGRRCARASISPGKYDDNKLESLAVNDEGVWVSSWNGLRRGQGGKWQQIDAPGGPGPRPHAMDMTAATCVVGAFERRYVRDGAGWRELAWPRTNILTRSRRRGRAGRSAGHGAYEVDARAGVRRGLHRGQRSGDRHMGARADRGRLRSGVAGDRALRWR